VSFAIAIAGLAALIILHEAGHFLVALGVGMRPRKFYVFFPPALAKIERRGIEYGIGAIPLGGYVKIPGMHRPAPSDLDVFVGRALEDAPELVAPLDRVRRAVATGEFETARARLPELRGAIAAADLPRARRRLAEKGLIDLEDALGSDAYWRQKTWKRIAVIVAGPAMNFVVAVALFTTVYVMGYGPGQDGTTILMVQKHEPAARGGLHVGDTIRSIDGTPVSTSEDVRSHVGRSPLTFTVVRDGHVRRVGPITPRHTPNGYRVGVALGKKTSVGVGIAESVKLTGDYVRGVAHVFTHRFTSEGRKQLSGPVGIVQASSEAYATGGTPAYLLILGLISLSLAVLNMLPLLPLDGGHILFSLIERIRGRAVGREIYERVSALGIAFGAIFFFIALSNDIGRLGG
jgi:regulator of sigma E protease